MTCKIGAATPELQNGCRSEFTAGSRLASNWRIAPVAVQSSRGRREASWAGFRSEIRRRVEHSRDCFSDPTYTRTDLENDLKASCEERQSAEERFDISRE